MKDEFKALVNVENEMVADEVIELLKNNGIEAFKQFDSGSMASLVYMNKPIAGINIDVEASDFEEAKALVEGFFKELKK
jgi:type III secretory pathway lipoprotein EscJ